MMVPVHHSMSFDVCMCTRVGMSVCVVCVSVCPQACVSVLCVWLDFVCVSELWLMSSLCNKCLAYSCCVWFGTDGNLSTLLINQTWCNPKETQELGWMPILHLKYKFRVLSVWQLWKPHLMEVKMQYKFCISFIKSNLFFILISRSIVLTPSVYLFYCFTPDLPYDLWPG